VEEDAKGKPPVEGQVKVKRGGGRKLVKEAKTKGGMSTGVPQ